MSRFRASCNKIFGGLTVDGEWSAGYLGNAEYIPLLGTDFNVRDFSNTGIAQQTSTIEGTFTIASPVRFTGGTMTTPGAFAGSGASYAMKIIPKGFEAYAFIVHGQAVPFYDVQAFASALDAPLATTISVAEVQNNEHAFSSVVLGDGSNYVIIKFEPGTANDAIYGGKIFIRAKT